MFDSHVHYDHKRFDNGRDMLLEKMHAEGLNYCLNAAIGFESNEQMIKLLKKYPWIYFAVGIHPNAIEIDSENDEKYMKKLYEWTQDRQVKAIGETGLDYYRLEQMKASISEAELEKIKKRQKAWFRISLTLAKETGLPLVLHIRGGADKDAMLILDECYFEGMRGVVHCFHGNLEIAKEYLKRGFSFGIGGMITRDGMEGLQEAVKKIPIDKIVLETDSPFVRPMGMEGKRNTSESLGVIANMVVELKGMSAEDVERMTEENAKKLFCV